MRTALKTSLLLAIVASILLAVPNAGTSAPKPPPVTGKWTGKANRGGDTYRVQVKIKHKLVKGLRGGTVDYPGLSCGGIMIFLRRSGKRYVFHEQLTYGQEVCVEDGINFDDGTSRFKRSGKKLLFRWTEADPTDPSRASGKLHRRR